MARRLAVRSEKERGKTDAREKARREEVAKAAKLEADAAAQARAEENARLDGLFNQF